MKQFLLLVGLSLGGMLGAFIRGPFVALCVYYLYAVLRPQAIWKFQMSTMPEFGWSFYVALAALLSYLPWVFGIVGPLNEPERRVFPRFVWPHRMMIGFSIWVTLSYLFANNQDRAWFYYQELLKVFLMYFLATQVIRAYWQIHILYLIVTFALGYIAFDVVQTYATSGYLVLFKRGFSDLDNNGAALMLAMGIPLLFFAWEFTKGWYRWGFLLMIPIIGEAVMSSYSRGAMISAVAVTPFYLLYSRKKKFLLMCFAMALVAVPVVAGKEIKERFNTVKEAGDDDSFNSRLMSWDCARRIANDYPVFGAGVRCSNLLTKQYGADLEGRTIHNQYLQIAADNGWLGLVWYLALLYTAFIAFWFARRRLWKLQDPESVRATAMLGGIECSLLTFLVGAIALSLETFELPYLLILLGTQIWSVMNAQVSLPPGYRHLPIQTVPLMTAKRRPVPVTGPRPTIPSKPLGSSAESGHPTASPTVPDFPPPGGWPANT